jgi:hypothetical protein
VNPVALGKTRAKQYALLKTSPADCKLGDKVMSVQLHGDASFSGQGVVMESLGLSEFLFLVFVFGVCLVFLCIYIPIYAVSVAGISFLGGSGADLTCPYR